MINLAQATLLAAGGAIAPIPDKAFTTTGWSLF